MKEGKEVKGNKERNKETMRGKMKENIEKDENGRKKKEWEGKGNKERNKEIMRGRMKENIWPKLTERVKEKSISCSLMNLQ